MTQASGILSSAHADEGVPQSHHGDSNKIETGAERHSLPNCSSIVVPQHEPGDYSVTAKVATAAGVLTRGIGSPDSPAAPFSRFIVRLNPLVYLRSYDDDGSFPTTKLDQAKLFASLDTAQGIADLLHGDVRRVIVNHREILLALTERRCADTGAKDNSAFDTKADASAERADGDEVPPSSTRSSIPSDAKKLFLEFVSHYLGVKVLDIQPGWKHHSDSYLFEGPHGTSMNVPTSVMLLDQASALAVIAEKISEKKRAFGTDAA